MRAFLREREVAVLLVEVRAEANELLHPVRPFVHEHVDGFRVAQARAGEQRILVMEFGLVVVREDGGDASLRIASIAVEERLLRDHKNALRLAQLQRRIEPGDARADNDNVGLDLGQLVQVEFDHVTWNHG